MSCTRVGIFALFLFLSIGNSDQSWAQDAVTGHGARNQAPLRSTQPTQVRVVPAQLTDFERNALQADEPIVTVTFPAITTDLGSNSSLSLTPHALTSFNSPDTLEALAVEFQLSQSLPATHGADLTQTHAVATLLDFDELRVFQSLFNALAVTGMPEPSFAGSQAVVRMTSKSGMTLALTPERGGKVRCVVSNEVDSVVLSLDAASAQKWADTFTEAARTLASARASK
jgi:hypothetical protein